MKITSGYELPKRDKGQMKYVCIKQYDNTFTDKSVEYNINLNIGELVSENQLTCIKWIMSKYFNLYVYDYFITLGEWRDQRINEILNDE